MDHFHWVLYTLSNVTKTYLFIICVFFLLFVYFLVLTRFILLVHVCLIFSMFCIFHVTHSPLPLSFQPIMYVRFMWLCHMTLAWCWWCRLRWWTEGNFLLIYVFIYLVRLPLRAKTKLKLMRAGYRKRPPDTIKIYEPLHIRVNHFSDAFSRPLNILPRQNPKA